jgi:O-antigen ligase
MGRVTLLLPAVRWWAVLVAVVGVPVVFATVAADPFSLPKFQLLAACTVVAGAATGAWWLSTSPRVVGHLPGGPAVAVLLGWTALATIWSRAPAVSVLGQYRRLDGLVPLLLSVAMAWMVSTSIRERAGRSQQLAVALAVSTVPAVAYVALQANGADPFNWLDADGQAIDLPYGLLGNSNFSGAHLAIALPAAVALWRWTAGWARVGAATVALAAAAGTWLTESRGGMLAALVGVAAAWLLRPDLLPRRLGQVVVLGAAAALVGTVLTVASGSTSWAGPAADLHLLRSVTLEQRAELWRGALGVIADEPVLGSGPDTMLDAFPPHRSREAARIAELNVDAAHNVFLHRAAGAGLPALAAYLVVVVAALRRAWSRRATADPLALAAFGGGLAAYLAQGLVSIDVIPLAFLGWVLVGAVGGITSPPPPRQVAVTPVPAVAVAVIGTAALAVLAVLSQPLVADTRFREAIELGNRDGDPLEVATRLEDVIAVHPLEPTYRTRYAQQLEVAAAGAPVDAARVLLDDALVAHARTLDLAPGRIDALTAWATATSRAAVAHGDPDLAAEGVNIAAAATDRDPFNWRAHATLAVAALTAAQLDEAAGDEHLARALAAAEAAVDLSGGEPLAWQLLAEAHRARGDDRAALEAEREAAAAAG